MTAEQFNQMCACRSLNREALRIRLLALDASGELYRTLVDGHPHLFADVAVFVSQDNLRRQLEIIAALEQVIAMPAYRDRVLAYAPETALFIPKAHGVFFGYDFHLNHDGPKLIEINSNAGGGLLNACLIQSQNPCCEQVAGRRPGEIDFQAQSASSPEQLFVEMFVREWRAERGGLPLQRIAIIDDQPENQYMFPEFMLFKHLFARQRIDAVICDPAELEYSHGAVWCNGLQIDLIYNRLTDFGLAEVKQRILRQAYLAGDVVLTPHPRNHALYADKRNLVLLCDADFLLSIGVDEKTRRILRQGIAHTIPVNAQAAETLWARRKQLFFKPAKGFGGKAAYRGDKLTRQVFNYILQHDYVAQTLIKPSERQLEIEHCAVNLKLDLRHYVYQGQTQLLCARLYQGQTTNFRTPGGGFAQVVVI
jgi:hypothetical protein